jgi:hypothetical protein
MLITKSGVEIFLTPKFIDNILKIGKVDCSKNIINFIGGKNTPSIRNFPITELNIMPHDRDIEIKAYDMYGGMILPSKLKLGRWKRKPFVVTIKKVTPDSKKPIISIWNLTTAAIVSSLSSSMINTFKTLNNIAGCKIPVPYIVDVLKSLYGNNWRCVHKKEVEFDEIANLVNNSKLVLQSDNHYIIAEDVPLINEINNLVFKLKK